MDGTSRSALIAHSVGHSPRCQKSRKTLLLPRRNRMILMLYREDIAAVVAALPPDSPTALHFRFILRKMESKELTAIAITEIAYDTSRWPQSKLDPL
jgi:hypothetical protein